MLKISTEKQVSMIPAAITFASVTAGFSGKALFCATLAGLAVISICGLILESIAALESNLKNTAPANRS